MRRARIQSCDRVEEAAAIISTRADGTGADRRAVYPRTVLRHSKTSSRIGRAAVSVQLVGVAGGRAALAKVLCFSHEIPSRAFSGTTGLGVTTAFWCDEANRRIARHDLPLRCARGRVPLDRAALRLQMVADRRRARRR